MRLGNRNTVRAGECRRIGFLTARTLRETLIKWKWRSNLKESTTGCIRGSDGVQWRRRREWQRRFRWFLDVHVYGPNLIESHGMELVIGNQLFTGWSRRRGRRFVEWRRRRLHRRRRPRRFFHFVIWTNESIQWMESIIFHLAPIISLPGGS